MDPTELISYLRILRPLSGVADLAFVLGSPRPEPAMLAANLYRNGKAKKILLTGKGRHVLPSSYNSESAFHEAILLGHEVPRDEIFREEKSMNTFENVAFGKDLLDRSQIQPKSIVAVCRWFHSRRVLMTLKRHFPLAELYTEVYDSPWDLDGNIDVTQLAKAKIEFDKIDLYISKGDLFPIED